MHYRNGCLVFFSFILMACTSHHPPAQPIQSNFMKTDASLAEASYAVSRSMTDLAEMEQSREPAPLVTAPPSPASYGMGGLTTVDWTGPVEPLVQQIAKAANYELRVLGNPPAIPVLVTIYRRNKMLGDILREVGYQCNKRATIIVFPETHTIELRYASN